MVVKLVATWEKKMDKKMAMKSESGLVEKKENQKELQMGSSMVEMTVIEKAEQMDDLQDK